MPAEVTPPGAPQSPTTGRWELIKELAGQKPQYPHKRWNEVPMWYRVLDRFGLPTLFVLLLCFAIGWTVRFALNEWTKHDAAVASAMLKQAEKTEDVAKEVHAMASDTHTQLSVMLDRLPRVLVTQQPAKPVPMQSPVNRLPQPLFLKATTK